LREKDFSLIGQNMLNALADFYESPEGNSAMKKMGEYMADVMPTLQEEMVRAVKRYSERKIE